jgi:hypothetical protein
MRTLAKTVPCPCGSGKKHGRCCWTQHPYFELDREVTERALRWVTRTRGVDWLAQACARWKERFVDLGSLGGWFWTCLLHHHEPGLFAEFLLDEDGLSLPQFTLAQAREHGKTSIYAVVPLRRGLVLEDMLDPGLSFTLGSNSPQLRRNTVVLGRVVHLAGESLLLSMHPHVLGRVFGLTVCRMVDKNAEAMLWTARWQHVVDELELPFRLGQAAPLFPA